MAVKRKARKGTSEPKEIRVLDNVSKSTRIKWREPEDKEGRIRIRGGRQRLRKINFD